MRQRQASPPTRPPQAMPQVPCVRRRHTQQQGQPQRLGQGQGRASIVRAWVQLHRLHATHRPWLPRRWHHTRHLAVRGALLLLLRQPWGRALAALWDSWQVALAMVAEMGLGPWPPPPPPLRRRRRRQQRWCQLRQRRHRTRREVWRRGAWQEAPCLVLRQCRHPRLQASRGQVLGPMAGPPRPCPLHP